MSLNGTIEVRTEIGQRDHRPLPIRGSPGQSPIMLFVLLLLVLLLLLAAAVFVLPRLHAYAPTPVAPTPMALYYTPAASTPVA